MISCTHEPLCGHHSASVCESFYFSSCLCQFIALFALVAPYDRNARLPSFVPLEFPLHTMTGMNPGQLGYSMMRCSEPSLTSRCETIRKSRKQPQAYKVGE